MLKKHRNKILILILLIVIGVVLQLSGWLEPEKLLTYARSYADQPWLMLVLVLLQVILFTFALAGSTFLWVAAVLYPPFTASLILAFGAAFGGLSAYYFSQKLTSDWIERVERSRVYRLLQRNDNFFMLLAMRLMPAFPHAVVNYSAGVLNVKRLPFFIAAVLGVGTKSYIYSKVIYQATSGGDIGDLVSVEVLAPLIIVTLITLLIAGWLNWKNRDVA